MLQMLFCTMIISRSSDKIFYIPQAVCLYILIVPDGFPVLFGVLDFRAGAVADVAVDVDDVDFVSHVDFPFVHVVEHFLRFREGSFVHAVPDFLVAGVAEEPNADDDITRKRQPLLGLHELILEAGAAAERDYFIVSYHVLSPVSCATEFHKENYTPRHLLFPLRFPYSATFMSVLFCCSATFMSEYSGLRATFMRESTFRRGVTGWRTEA